MANGYQADLRREAWIHAHGSDTLRHHATCTVFVASHEAAAGAECRLWNWGEGQYNLSPHVQQCSFDETFNGQRVTMTLIPVRPYHKMVFPGDWISVYYSTNSDAPPDFAVLGRPDRRSHNDRVLMGTIDSVRVNTTVADNGTVSVRIELSASGVQNTIAKTNVYYNEHLGPETLFGGQLPGLAIVTKSVPFIGTPSTIPRAIALTFMGFGGQFLLPKSYPMGETTVASRKDKLRTVLDTARNIEKDLGIFKVRGTGGNAPVREGVVQTVWQKHRDRVQPNSLTHFLDLFTYVEDEYMDGRVMNSPNDDLQGSVWQKMMENCNPVMNECYITMLPPSRSADLGSAKDEWNQFPKYQPSLVIRERPFSWVPWQFEVPTAFFGRTKARIAHFGDVFFSSRQKPANVKQLQRKIARTTLAAVGTQNPEDMQYQSFVQQKLKLNNVDYGKVVGYQQRAKRKDFLRAAQEVADLGQITLPDDVNITKLQEQIKAKPGFVYADSGDGQRFVDRIKLNPRYIKSESLGLADNDMHNFWMMTQAMSVATHQKYTFLAEGLIPIFLAESIRRYGLRTREITTKFGHAGGVRLDGQSAQNFLFRCLLAQDLWYQNQMSYRAGQISIPGMPKAHVGMVLDIVGGGREESFYVEGVSHNWSHPGVMTTNLTVTRGQPGLSDPTKRFSYAPPNPIKIFKLGGLGSPLEEIARVNATNQPKVQLRAQDLSIETIVREASGPVPDSVLEDIIKKARKEKKNPLTELRNDGFLNAKSVAKLQQIAEKTTRDPTFKVKEDRQRAGRIEWSANPALVDTMHDPVRRPSEGTGSAADNEKAATWTMKRSSLDPKVKGK